MPTGLGKSLEIHKFNAHSKSIFMKAILYVCSLSIFCIFCFDNKVMAQGSVGIGTPSPNAAAILEITSTNKGVLMPRMNTQQKNLIPSPVPGLLIYQTDSVPGYYYYGSSWQRLPSAVGVVNDSLSNLALNTVINTDLLPDTNAKRNIGSAVKAWKNIYSNGDIYMFGNRFLNVSNTSNNYIGTFAGMASTTGFYNTAVGYQALTSNLTGTSNTAAGYQALYTNTGTYNSATGFQALYYNTTGYANTAFGSYALYANTTGSYNIGFGADALIGITTGSNNTAVGLDALRNLNTTNSNTGIGYYAAENTYSTFQGTFLGAQTRGGTGLSNVTAVGYGATATASNSVMLGNTAVTSVKAAGSFVIYSDGRFKKDIRQDVPGLDFINQLRPVTYHYNIRDLNKYLDGPVDDSKNGVVADKARISDNELNEQAIKNKERILYTGFIAQEVEAAAKNLQYDFSGVYKPANSNDVYGLSYSDFVVPLVKAVQELNKKNESQARELGDQQRQINELKETINRIMTQKK